MKERFIRIVKRKPYLLRLISIIYSLPNIINYKGINRNVLRKSGSFLAKTIVNIKGIGNEIHLKPENRLNNCKITVIGNNCSIIIGKHCILKNLELWIEDDNGVIEIGDYTTIEGGHLATIEGRKILIGKDCMFSHDVVIRTGDSHSIIDQMSGNRINKSQDVHIGNHVWLGEGVKVLKGSEILDNSIVGTSSLVSGKVEINSIFAGVPARVIKQNVNWKRQRI